VKQRHVRSGDDLRGDEVIVIGGGELDPAVLRSDAVRDHSIYLARPGSICRMSSITGSDNGTVRSSAVRGT
jgi:hypothetical protein